MFVRQLFVHLYMVGQLIGMLSVMIWQEIFIAIIGCVRKCWQIVEKTLRKNYIYSVCGFIPRTQEVCIMAMYFEKDFYVGTKYRAMTGSLRRAGGDVAPFALQDVYRKCDTSVCLGALPPELRACVAPEDVNWATVVFRAELDKFIASKKTELDSADRDMVYEMPVLSQLFGTRCIVESRGINVYGVHPWGGAVGYVCKLFLPEIGVHYALKLYHKKPMLDDMTGHGPLYEIPVAFAANKAEPKDNNTVYMASLAEGGQYILSAWAGDKVDSVRQRENKYKIFKAPCDEDEVRNLRHGRRIDWGETSKTLYGKLSYRGRKLYRQIMNRDVKAVQQSCMRAKGQFDRRDLVRALKIVGHDARESENLPVRIFLRDLDLRTR